MNNNSDLKVTNSKAKSPCYSGMHLKITYIAPLITKQLHLGVQIPGPETVGVFKNLKWRRGGVHFRCMFSKVLKI